MKRALLILIIMTNASVQGLCQRFDFLRLSPALYGGEGVGLGVGFGSMHGWPLGFGPLFVQGGVIGCVEGLFLSFDGGGGTVALMGAEVPLTIGCVLPCSHVTFRPTIGLFASAGVEVGRFRRRDTPFYWNAGWCSGIDVCWRRFGMGFHYLHAPCPEDDAFIPVRRISVSWLFFM